MPIQNNPPRQIGTSIQRSQNDQYAVERGGGAFNGITEEAITATNADGSYAVGNTWLTTSGVSQPINVGDIVKVGWHGGKPVVILSHTARRAKFVPPPPVGGPIVEMLLAAPTATFAVNHSLDSLDVYFRNANQTTLLKCRDQITAAGFVIATGSFTLLANAWGLDHRTFMVQFINQTNNHPIIAIFHVSGSATTSITGSAQAKLTTTIDVGASLLALGSMSWTQNVLGGFSATTALVLGTLVSTGYSVFAGLTQVQRASGTIRNACFTKDHHCIISLDMLIANQPGGGGGLSAEFFYPYLIDLTAGTVLFNGIAQQAVWPTTIYNGASFISVGPGLYDESGTGTNAWDGGAQFYTVPDTTGNASRLFVGVRAFYTGGNISLAGKIQQHVQARDVSTGVVATIFPLTTYAVGDSSHLALLSADSRYVMWMRASPGSLSSPQAFEFPHASALATYDFKEGIHITDLGVGKLIGVTDAIPLTIQTDIESFLDQAPYLTSTALMWEDHNDLRVAVDPNSTVPNSRVAPEFVNFRANSPTGPVISVPFTLPLRRLGSIQQQVATLKAIPTTKQYIVDMVVAQYTVSGHQDMVVGYGIFNNSSGNLVSLQVIPGSGSLVPNR